MIEIDNLKTVEITDNFIAKSFELITYRLNTTRDAALKKSLEQRRTPGGQDRSQTTLKRMPYQKYSIVSNSKGLPYFCGKTDDIILDIKTRHNREFVKYNIGPYFVCLSMASAMATEINPIHVFPAYDPTTPHRHLHHYTYDEGLKNPLNADPRTCWASVGPSYLNAIRNADVVDMFRIMYIFVVRLDYGSVFDWDWPEEAIRHGERIE